MHKFIFSIVFLATAFCPKQPIGIEGVWWYLDGVVYHEIEFFRDKVFDRRSFRSSMSSFSIANPGVYFIDSDTLSIQWKKDKVPVWDVKFELDTASNELHFIVKEHVVVLKRVLNLELSIGHVLSTEQPALLSDWRQYIQGFYEREFNCYVEHDFSSQKEAQVTRDSLAAIEIKLLEQE